MAQQRYQQISNDPQYGFLRAVDLEKTEVAISLKGEYVNLSLELAYFKEGTSVDEANKINLIPPRVVSLLATNTTFVNPANGIPYPSVDEEGNPIPPPEGAVPEFTFFRAAMGNPVVIDNMIVGKILWADSVGRFDQEGL